MRRCYLDASFNGMLVLMGVRKDAYRSQQIAALVTMMPVTAYLSQFASGMVAYFSENLPGN